MTRQNRTQLVLGILLIAAGVYYMLALQNPALRIWMGFTFQWPFYVIGAGALILLLGLLSGSPGAAVPACIVAGIGGILYYQNRTGDWASWAYLWTLIPAFGGLGTLLMALMGENTRYNLGHGLNQVVLGAVLFVVFAALFGHLSILGPFGPAGLLVVLGIYVIARGLMRGRTMGG